jgi:catechol 2,3-dioxygenase-like lactoylglutathione lyase family enzyme
MFKYVTLGSNDLSASGRFYDAALAPLGIARLVTTEHELGYGLPPAAGEKRKCWLYVLKPFNGKAATSGNGVDIAFAAPSRAAVDAFHAAAMAQGGQDEGPPGLRTHYTPLFYTAYVRDPFGNKINAVFDQPVG